MKSSSLVNSTILATASASSTAASNINSQFKHTIMWNGIIGHLRSKVTELNGSGGAISSRLRKQHSRFVSGGMLLIRPNPTDLDSQIHQQSRETCFSGSQCVDIVYQYLIDNKSVLNFERQVTRDKCVKV